MAHEFIPVRGYRTGNVERLEYVRHGLAFDLTDIDFHGRAIVSAALQLPAPASATVTSIELSDPADQVRYGAASCDQWTDIASVPLSFDAMQDLRGAAGAYFSVDVVLEDASGQPSELHCSGARAAVLLVVTEQAAEIAHAAEIAQAA